MSTRAAVEHAPTAQSLPRISPEYRELNAQLHRENPGYGVYGRHFVSPVRVLTMTVSRDVLDYGCGKRLLEQGLGFPIHNYDPAIPGLDAPPDPAAVVVCTAVLEHIEPDLLDNVLDDLARLTRRAGFLVIGTARAAKQLPDGRNAHLLVETGDWWAERLAERFRIRLRRDQPETVTFVVQPRSLSGKVRTRPGRRLASVAS